MDAFWPVVLGLALAISLIAGIWLGYSSRDGRAHINAARGLGASEWRVFWRIGLPLSVRPIVTSAALVLLGVLAAVAVFLWRIRS